MAIHKDNTLVQFLFITQIVLIVTVAYLVATKNSPNSTPIADSTITPTLSPTPTLEKGWQIFKDEVNKFSLSYPEKWFNLPSIPNQPNQRFFSNENVGAPLELSPKGIWVTVTTHKQDTSKFTPIFKATKGLVKDIKDLQITKLQDLNINGSTAVKYSTLPNPDFAGDGGYTLEYAIKSRSTIYEISFYTPLNTFAKQSEVLYSQIANSFKLN